MWRQGKRWHRKQLNLPNTVCLRNYELYPCKYSVPRTSPTNLIAATFMTMSSVLRYWLASRLHCRVRNWKKGGVRKECYRVERDIMRRRSSMLHKPKKLTTLEFPLCIHVSVYSCLLITCVKRLRNRNWIDLFIIISLLIHNQLITPCLLYWACYVGSKATAYLERDPLSMSRLTVWLCGRGSAHQVAFCGMFFLSGDSISSDFVVFVVCISSYL